MSTRFTILVVEDEPLNMQLMFRRLQKLGYEVLKAENGKIAMEVLETNSPALVLLDLKMPVMDGFEVIETLNKARSLPDLPVIVVSANHIQEHRDLVIQSGCRAFVDKPVDFKLLSKLIEDQLEPLINKLEEN